MMKETCGNPARESRASVIEGALNRLSDSIEMVRELKREMQGEPQPPKAECPTTKTSVRPIGEIILQLPAHLDGLREELNKIREQIREIFI